MRDGEHETVKGSRFPELRFADADLEQQFRRDFNRSALPFVRIACVYGIVGYSLFEILEYFLVPGYISK